MRSADLLGELATTFQLRDGPDVIVTRGAGASAGLTVWLQNPYDAPLHPMVVIHKPDDDKQESVALRLGVGPLEIGAMVIPTRRSNQELAVKVICEWVADGTPRTRVVGSPGQYDRKATALGLMQGVAGLALFGVGRFSTAKRGGIVNSPLELKVTTEGPVMMTGDAQFTRIWAPQGAAAPSEPQVSRRSTNVWEMTRLGWAVVFGCYVIGYTIASAFDPTSQGASLGLFIGTIGAVVISLVAKYRHVAPLAREPASLFA